MIINIQAMVEAGFVVDVDKKHGQIVIYPEHPVKLEFDLMREALDHAGVDRRDADEGIEALCDSIHTSQIVRAIKQQS